MYKIHYVWNLCRKKFHKMLKINSLRAFFRSFLGARFSFLGIGTLAGGVFALLLVIGLTGCQNGSKDEKGGAAGVGRLFNILAIRGETVVDIRSMVGRDTLVRRFVLRDSVKIASGKSLPKELAGATVLRVPLQRVVALSSSQVGYMLRLGLEDRIVAVGEGRYVADSVLYAKFAAAKLDEVGNGSSLAIEKLVALKPDLVMTFATGGGEDDYQRLEMLGLPVMLTSEWQDENPIAKAEWIKLYGILFDAGDGNIFARADSIYRHEKLVYDSLASLALPKDGGVREIAGALNRQDSRSSFPDSLSHSPCPRVLVGMSYGGVWYAPGGKSYTARLIADAGGCYLWANDTTREMKLSMEEILALADSADVWLNPGMFTTLDEVIAADPRVKRIKAFKNCRVFQNDGRRGPGGGNDFYERAVARPAELLQNLSQVLHPDLSGDIAPILDDSVSKWYRNICSF